MKFSLIVTIKSALVFVFLARISGDKEHGKHKGRIAQNSCEST